MIRGITEMNAVKNPWRFYCEIALDIFERVVFLGCNAIIISDELYGKSPGHNSCRVS